jgi:signal transduction histidine kinase
MSRTSVDLGQIAHECIAILRDAEPRRNVQCSVAPAMWAQCDAGLMRVALHNLLSNAWKFSGRKVEPHIEVGTEPGPGGQVWYFVRDNGIGFDPSEAHRLFEPFQRLHGDSFSGEGIGLATVKRIIDRHRGSLWVVSQPGKGSTFYFTLPPDTISS